MEEKPKHISKKTIIIIVTLMITLIVGISYAFLGADIGRGANTDVITQFEKIDLLDFDVSNELSFTLSQTTFTEGGDNETTDATATASLTANEKTHSAAKKYNVYLVIDKNTFSYTTDEKTPEMTVTITNPNGNTVRGIEGLDEISNGVYDITNAEGVFQIASNYDITSNSSTKATVQEWQVVLNFINLDTNQVKNAGKNITGKIIMQEDAYQFTLAEYLKTSAQTDSTLFKHDFSLLNGAEDDNYRFSGANYTLTEKASAYSNVDDYDSTANGVIKMYCSRGTAYSYVGKNCTSSYTRYYYLAYDTNKTQYDDYDDAAKKALADGYIQGNVNNFICFGSDADTCSVDNLYRIIGVFDGQVKLIKYDYANSNLLGINGDYTTTTYTKSDYSTYKGSLTTINRYSWNYMYGNKLSSNNWETSLLNRTNLNTNYINYLNSFNPKWVDMIANTKWNIGGHNTYSDPVKTFYNAEKTKQTVGFSKIGLMYLSDFGWATSPNNWGTNLDNYNTATIRYNNWMLTGLLDWTLTPNSSDSDSVFNVSGSGSVNSNLTFLGCGVRPVLHLKSNAPYISGAGTSGNPYRIALKTQ